MGRKRNLWINVGQQDALCSFWGLPPYLNLLRDSKGLSHAGKPRHSSECYPLRVADTALLSDSPVAWAFGLDLLYSIALPYMGVLRCWAFTRAIQYFIKESWLPAAGKTKGSTTCSLLLERKTPWATKKRLWIYISQIYRLQLLFSCT